VLWDVQPKAIIINWRESGVPRARAPSQTGFGTRIVVSSIERHLGGKTNFEWRSVGLTCTLAVPRSHGVEIQNELSLDSPEPASAEAMAVQRIMIVEDEALVAMILEDQLKELGLSIVASCATVREAMAAIDEHAPDAAILDVNLRGQTVYPVADRLKERGIPFVFVTGYGRESIDQRYTSIQVLEKPIERQVLEKTFAGIGAGFGEIGAVASAGTR
jgi:CheY-like chemotaxis protein